MKNLVVMTFLALTTVSVSAQEFDIQAQIRTFCAREWPGDYRMQKYCVNQQIEAAQKVIGRYKTMRKGFGSDSEQVRIIMRCLGKWGYSSDNKQDTNWRMAEYCAQRQFKAFRSLQD